jgi:hypothetical protein
MDYGMAIARQKINLETKWSASSLERNYGAHHRWEYKEFIHQSFLVPMDIIANNKVSVFDFSIELQDLANRTVIDAEGYYRVPMDLSKIVRVPEKFSQIF